MEDDSSVILGSESTPLPQPSNYVPPVGHNSQSNLPEGYETVGFTSELKDVSAGDSPILTCPGDQHQSLPPTVETHPPGLGTIIASSTGVNDALTTYLPRHGQPYATHPELPGTNGIIPTQVHQESVHSATHVAPTKRFTSVNVNRKFLEKTHSSSTVPTPTQNNKPNALGPTPRTSTPPQPQTHSKLVTAKLTSTGVPSHASAGWTKNTGHAAPGSSMMPFGATPNGSATTESSAIQSNPAASKNNSLSVGGGATNPLSKTGLGVSRVWGNASQFGRAMKPIPTPSDFPTAAEASSSRKAKPVLQPPQTVQAPQDPASALLMQQAAASADAFRGLHLDPNAHHWDEMGDEDGDDFLAEVIEFGDGTQYTIKAESQAQPADVLRSTVVTQADDGPVTKEERFSEDFDRSWPRDQGSTATSFREPASRSPRHPPLEILPRPAEGRALFNERSNRFEPTKPPRVSDSRETTPPSQMPLLTHRPSVNGHGKGQAASINDHQFHGRDPPPHTNLHVPPKSVSHKMPSTRPLQYPSSKAGQVTSLLSPKDAASPLSSLPSQPPSRSSSVRDTAMPQSLPATQVDPRPLVPRDQPDGSSVSTGPSSSHPGTRRASHSMGDESTVHPPLTVAEVSQTPQPSATNATPGPSELGLSAGPPSTVPFPGTPLALKTITQTDIAVFSKESMQSAAERARERRRLEEEEREKEKDRARRKAESLAALMESASEPTNPKAVPVPVSQEPSASQQSVPRHTTPPSSRGPAVTTGNDGPVWRTRSRTGSQRNERNSFVPQPPSRTLPPAKEDEVPVLLYSSDKSRTSKEAPAARVVIPSPVTSPPVPKYETPPTNNRDAWRPGRDVALVPRPISFDVPDVSEALRVGDEHLETIDFSDLSKLVDFGENVTASPPVSIPSANQTNFTIPRPESSIAHNADQKPHDFTQSVPDAISAYASSSGTVRSPRVHLRNVSEGSQDTSQPQPSSHSHLHSFSASHPPLRHSGPQPPGTKHQFKEVPMAALDDVMLRIKGALITMHPGEMAENGMHNLDDEAYRASRLAEIHAAHPHTSAERENFTQSQIPRPPTPQHTKPRVRLKSIHRRPPQQPINTRLLHLWRLPPKPVRWDILSWNPPIANMSRRSLSLEEILFPHEGEAFVVALPMSKVTTQVADQDHVVAASLVRLARVQLPLGSTTTFKPAQSSNISEGTVRPVNPISRSPPPSSPARGASLSLPKTDRALSALDDSSQPGASKAKSAHKLPVGTDVAFYKSPSSSTASAPSSNVRFLVSSEVDKTITSPLLEGTFATTMQAADDERDDKPLTASSSRVATPPPTTQVTTAWAKSPIVYAVNSSSNIMAAGSDRIKSLWDTTTKEDTNTAENSLKGIADDYPPALPTSEQELKSDEDESGKEAKSSGTNSPAPTPSRRFPRMSVHDVTRAFQQVPRSTSPSAETPSPPSEAPSAQASRTTPSQTPNPYLQSSRASYPSHHMPQTPPVMYSVPYSPSPLAARSIAGGHDTSQHTMWVPMPSQVYRASPSSYPSVMSYVPQAGYQAIMSVASKVTTPVAPTGRGRGIPTPHMMSPIAPPSTTNAYSPTPVHQHPYAMRAPVTPQQMAYPPSPVSGYGVPIPAGRGTMHRPPNGYDPHTPVTPQNFHPTW